MKIEDLGYNAFFEENRNRLGWASFPVARVTSEHKGAYRVKGGDGEYLARVTGKRMFEALSREDYPAVGDWVVLEGQTIQGILPRKSIIKRKYGDKTQVVGANLDVAFVVESVDRDYNLNRFERYFSLAESGFVKPAIVLNKVDLLSAEELEEKLAELKSRFWGTEIIAASAIKDAGLDDLKSAILPGKTYCFLGSSGVGKSSLINKLLGEDEIKTADISSYSGRGKHVTTVRQMFFLKNGGIVIDNPGMREVGVGDAHAGIENVFGEFVETAQGCRYPDCTHGFEPGCAVLEAVRAGELSEEKYKNYVSLKKESEHYELTQVEKREKDRRFGKFLKKAQKDLKNLGHKNWP